MADFTYPRVAGSLGRVVGMVLVAALVAAVTPAGAVPAPPRAEFPADRTHALTLDFDGTQLPERIVAASIGFAAPDFVEAVYSTGSCSSRSSPSIRRFPASKSTSAPASRRPRSGPRTAAWSRVTSPGSSIPRTVRCRPWSP